jgi:hypothetical protein
MANRISEIVQAVADQVEAYAVSALESAKRKKQARALKSMADAFGENVEIDIADAHLNSDDFAALAAEYEEVEAAAGTEGTELAKSIARIKVYVEDDVLEENDLAEATRTITLWDEVKPAARMFAVRGTQSQGRTSTPDFEFPIFAICEDGVVIETGARSGVTDWNSLRHYTQRHAQNVHMSEKFSPFVSSQWQNAKRAFQAGESEVVIEGDESSPSVTLQRQEVVAQVG